MVQAEEPFHPIMTGASGGPVDSAIFAAETELLVRDKSPLLWLFISSEGYDRALILKQLQSKKADKSKYELEYVEPQTPIVKCNEADTGLWVCKVDSNVAIERTTTRIPSEVAHDLIQIWGKAMSEASNTGSVTEGMDAPYYYIFVPPDQYAYICCPVDGKARLLADLGNLLIEWTLPERVHGKTMDNIKGLIRQLQRE